IQRWRDGDLGQCLGDVIGEDGLDESRGQADSLFFGSRIDNGTDEFEELGGANDSIGNGGSLDQFFLRHLGAEIAAGKEAIGGNYRKRYMMADAGSGFGGEEVFR